jgi:hypothetical protein
MQKRVQMKVLEKIIADADTLNEVSMVDVKAIATTVANWIEDTLSDVGGDPDVLIWMLGREAEDE